MSKESAKKFVADLSNKTELMQEVYDNAEKISGGDGLEYLCDFANKKGYDFSLEEIKIFMEETNKMLNDNDLSNVAGGAGWKDIAKGVGITALKTLLFSFANKGKLTIADVKDAALEGIRAGTEQLS